MPKLNINVTDAEQVWASPDGKKAIYAVTFQWEGKTVKGKTYSQAIANAGWSGEVETYEKEGRNGPETFIKQPPREGFGSYSNNRSSYKAADGGKRGYDSNPYTMYLSYAKDLLVALITSKEYSDDLYQKLLQDAVKGGDFLYNHQAGQAALPVQPAEPDNAKEQLTDLFKDSDPFFVEGETIPWIADK